MRSAVRILLVAAAVVAAAGCLAQERSKAVNEVPRAVTEYLTASDGLGRAAAKEAHPDLDVQLKSPETREAILRYLGTDAAWTEKATVLDVAYLGFLVALAKPAEVRVIRPFLLHPHPRVRLKAYEYLVQLHFPDKNREALFQLVQEMLMDPDDVVRTAGARFVERAEAADELRPFLVRWRALAPLRGWTKGEAHEVVESLLR